MNTTMTLRPSLTGGTKINVSPLGALELRQPRRAPSASTSTSTSSTRTAPRPSSTTPSGSPASRTRSPGTSSTAPSTWPSAPASPSSPAPPPSASPSTAAPAGPSPPAASPSPCWPPRGVDGVRHLEPEVRPGAEVLRAALLRPLPGRQRAQHRHRIRRLPAGVGPPGHQRDEAVRRHVHAPRLPAGPDHDPGPARLRHPSQPGELEDHRLARGAVRDRRDRRLRRHDGPRHGRRERLPGPDPRPRRALRLGPRQPRLAASRSAIWRA